MSDSGKQIVVAVTGASGAIYTLRLVQTLLCAGCQLHVVISNAAKQVFQEELGVTPPQHDQGASGWLSMFQQIQQQSDVAWNFREAGTVDAGQLGSLRQYGLADFRASAASGSARIAGMVVCPCSMGTLSSIACGASSNLIHRAADVQLKERRPLILVPRETPLGLIQLENMVRLSQAGATILPAMPGFYHGPQGMGDLVDFIVARICDHLDVPHQLSRRWGQSTSDVSGPDAT